MDNSSFVGPSPASVLGVKHIPKRACRAASLSCRPGEDPHCLVGSLFFPFRAWLVKLSQNRAAQSNFPAQHNPRRPFTFWPEEGNCIPLLALIFCPSSVYIPPPSTLVISQAFSLGRPGPSKKKQPLGFRLHSVKISPRASIPDRRSSCGSARAVGRELHKGSVALRAPADVAHEPASS